MREEVPEGESLEHWTRMVSTDRFGGLAARTTPENYIADVVRNVERWCPGTQVGPLKSLSMTGRPATRVTINCPQLSLTGKSVTFTMEVTTGTFDLLVNEVAFQGAPTPADAAWATQFLDNLIYCAGGTTVSACTREPPPRLTKPYHEKPLLPWP